jgi:hypothetical protein
MQRDDLRRIFVGNRHASSKMPAIFRKSSHMRIITILSLPRSGTSLAANIIGTLGATLPDDCIPPHADINPDGFFESATLLDIRVNVEALLGLNFAFPLSWSEPDWVDALSRPGMEALLERAMNYFATRRAAGVKDFVFKDPRTAAILPFWLEVFRRAKLKVHYVVAVRDPVVTAKSIQRFNHHSLVMGTLFWLESFTHIFTMLERRPFTLVVYDRWFNGDEQIQQVAQSLFKAPPSNETLDRVRSENIKAVLNRSAVDAHEKPEAIFALANTLYAALLKLPTANRGVRSRIFDLAQSFTLTVKALGNVLHPDALDRMMAFDKRALVMETKIGDLEAEVARLQESVAAPHCPETADMTYAEAEAT